jgi:hypothetical protein
MAMPAMFAVGAGGVDLFGQLHQQRLVDRQRQPGPRLAVGLGAEGLAGRVPHLTARGVGMEDLLHEQGEGGGGVQVAIAPAVVIVPARLFDARTAQHPQRIALDLL